MTLWHKSTESAKGSGLVVVKKGKNVGIMTAYEHRSQAPASRWCYLTELLKLEQENKKSQEKLEIAIEALRLYSNLRGDGTVSNYESVAKSALKEIKELNNDRRYF